jgi:SAM-dependent methyltransferase
MSVRAERDTDADWRALGETQPYWAVLSSPDMRTETITPEGVEGFYASGRQYIAQVAAWLADATGSPPAGRALDFGCGAGRLTEAMTDYAQEVVGVDVSPGMLALARKRGGLATYTDRIPQGPFDWINSFIVFQHIEPIRGLPILEELLSKLAPGGAVSLQITIWFEPRNIWPEPTGWRRLFRDRIRRKWIDAHPPGIILMYPYDLSEIVRLLNLAGIEEMKMIHTDHDGHHGVVILGRKAVQPSHA